MNWITLVGVVLMFLFLYAGIFFWLDRKKVASIISYIVSAVLFVSLFYMAHQRDKNNKGACEKIGGHYIVVGHEQSGKTRVAIYGCVKE